MAHWSYRHPKVARFVRSRAFLIIGAIVSVALIGTLVWGVGVAIARIPPARPEPEREPAVSASSLTADPTTDPSLTPDDPASQANPDSITCWDGDQVESLDSCTSPEGVAGLKYVFPSLSDNLGGTTYDCAYVDYPNRPEFTFSYDCPLAGDSIDTAVQLVRYRYWTDTKVSLKHYKKVFKDGDKSDFILDGRDVGTMYRSNTPDEYGRYVTAFILFKGRMCLSVEGSSQSLLDDMLPEARFRAAADLHGFSGPAPAEGTWAK